MNQIIRYKDMTPEQQLEYMREKKKEHRIRKAAGITGHKAIIIDGVTVKYKDMTTEQRRKYVAEKMRGYRAEDRLLNPQFDQSDPRYMELTPEQRKGYHKRKTNEWLEKRRAGMTPEQVEADIRFWQDKKNSQKKIRYNEDPEYKKRIKMLRLCRVYNLTESQVELLDLTRSCPICSFVFTSTILSEKSGRSENMPVIDHVHGSDPVQVRGVICAVCNKQVVETLERHTKLGTLDNIVKWIRRQAVNHIPEIKPVV